MSKQVKTRMVAKIQGELRELLSIIERKNGDLILFPQYALKHEGKFQDEIIAHQKVSLHNSRNSNSGGYTIKHSMMLKSGRERDQVQFSQSLENNKIALVQSRTFPFQSSHRYKLLNRQYDKVVEISHYNLPPLCLMEHILCFKGNFSDVFWNDAGFTQNLISFKNFSVLTLHAILPTSALPGSDWIRPITSLPREQQTDPVAFLCDGKTKYEDVRAAVIESSIDLKKMTLARQKKIISSNPQLRNSFAAIERIYTKGLGLQWYPLDFFKDCLYIPSPRV